MSQKEHIDNWKRVEYLMIKKNQYPEKNDKKISKKAKINRQILKRWYQN